MKISIVIPIYKVEKYLQRCIESVLEQTYKDFEILLIDDGSPDNCPLICDEYACKDSRITVIHKENGGLSDARNMGVKIASGEYGGFLDGDDYWDNPTAIERICERMQITQPDVLIFSYYKKNEERQNRIEIHRVPNMPIKYTDIKDQMSYLFKNGLYIASACTKIVSMDILKILQFERDRFSEDVFWSAGLLNKVKSLDYIDLCFYCYRQREGSIAHSISKKNCEDLAYAVEKCCQLAQNNKGYISFYLKQYGAYQFATFIAVQSFSAYFEKDIIKKLEACKWALKFHGEQRKVKYMYKGITLMGLMNWCRLIRITRRLWDSQRDKI